MASPATTTSARPFTYEDLEGMPDDGYRREIIGGSLIVSPSPSVGHQLVVSKLVVVLREAQPPGVQSLVAPLDVRAPGEDVVEPDLLVIRLEDVEDDRLRRGSIPLLVVEILSPSNRDYDLVTKRTVYERAGVPSYWIVDPAGPSLLALRLGSAGTYELEAEVVGSERFATDRPFPVSLTPGDLTR